MSSRDTTLKAFMDKLKAFFGDDVKLGNAMNAHFHGHLSLPNPHLSSAGTGLSLKTGADVSPSSLQKLSLTCNKDRSIRAKIQIYAKNMKEFQVCVPAKYKLPNGEFDLSVFSQNYLRDPNDTRDSYYAYEFTFDVVKGEKGLVVKGVGEHPSSIKFDISNSYRQDPTSRMPEGVEPA